MTEPSCVFGREDEGGIEDEDDDEEDDGLAMSNG